MSLSLFSLSLKRSYSLSLSLSFSFSLILFLSIVDLFVTTFSSFSIFSFSLSLPYHLRLQRPAAPARRQGGARRRGGHDQEDFQPRCVGWDRSLRRRARRLPRRGEDHRPKKNPKKRPSTCTSGSPTSPSSEPPIAAMTNHRGFRTRPSTMSTPTDNPSRSANYRSSAG